MSNEFATGLLERNWHANPMGDVPGAELWRPSANGPILTNWETATVPVTVPKQWEDDSEIGEFDYNQGGDPSCTLFSTGNTFQNFFAYNSRPILKLDCRKAWVEITGGRGGAELAAAVRYTLNTGMPIVGGGRIKALAWADLPNAAAVFSAVQLRRPVLMGWSHPQGAHAQCGLFIPQAKVLGVRGTWGRNASGEVWRNVPYNSLVSGIANFGAFALIDVEILSGQGDVTA